MKIFRMLCLALSQGLILGLIASAIRQTLRRRNHPDFTYTPKQLEEGRRRWEDRFADSDLCHFCDADPRLYLVPVFPGAGAGRSGAGGVCQQSVGNDCRLADDHLDRLRVLRVSAAWTIKNKKNRQSAGVFEKNDRFPEFTASSGNRLGTSFTE